MSKQGILQCFIGADLRAGHDGLAELAKKSGIDTRTIGPGSYLVFVNNKKDKLKMFAGNQVIAYLRLPEGRKINMMVIKDLPRVFNGKSINYEAALAKAVDDALAKTKSGGAMRTIV